MKLTKESTNLISFFTKNHCNSYLPLNKKTNVIIERLYHEFVNAENYIQMLKAKMGESFYNVDILQIEHTNQIPMPKTFASDGFPPDIRKHITQHTLFHIHYVFQIMNRRIEICILLDSSNLKLDISKYNTYVDAMLVWLLVLNKYASKKCAEKLIVYIYLTNLEKKVPVSNMETLNQTHVNTAFTMTCPKNSEIVIFRKEEWFKVFIHETFHNFGLDFSGINNEICKQRILSLFPVKSEVNLFEAYSEFWAKIINCIFCSYMQLKNKNDIRAFLSNFEILINLERIYSLFQMVKVLQFMNLTYEQLYKSNNELLSLLYKEQTNVLSYYVITLLLVNNYTEFIQWCNTNNSSLLQFKKTNTNLHSLCTFIERNYKTKSLLHCIHVMEQLLVKLRNQKTQKKENKYMLDNLRMTICELG